MCGGVALFISVRLFERKDDIVQFVFRFNHTRLGVGMVVGDVFLDFVDDRFGDF